jgi:hypothetical protein
MCQEGASWNCKASWSWPGLLLAEMRRAVSRGEVKTLLVAPKARLGRSKNKKARKRMGGISHGWGRGGIRAA